MCQTMELMRNESLLEGKIFGAIDMAREENKSDEWIVSYLVRKRLCASESEAREHISEYDEEE